MHLGVPQDCLCSLLQLKTTESFIGLTLKFYTKWHSHAVSYCFFKWLDSFLLFPCRYVIIWGRWARVPVCPPLSFTMLPPSVSPNIWRDGFPSLRGLTRRLILGRLWNAIMLWLRGNAVMWLLGEISDVPEEAGVCLTKPNNNIFNF